MKFKTTITVCIAILSLNGFSQTLYVPGGTGGIGYSGTSNVGIGTNNPSNVQGWNQVLDVRGTSHSKILSTTTTSGIITGIFSHIGAFGSACGFMGTESNHPLHFVTNYTPKLTITTNGNVGIGNLSPSKQLQISNSTGSSVFRMDALYTSYNQQTTWDFENNSQQSALYVKCGVIGTSTINSTLATNTRFAFKFNGFMGLNTDSPQKNIHILGTNDNGYSSTIRLENSTSYWDIDNNTYGDFNIYSSSGNGIYIKKSNGNVGISAGTNPADKLTVNGNVRAAAYLLPDGTPYSTGSSPWQTNGSNVYYNLGNVGIGTNTPQSNLEIANTTTTTNMRFASDKYGFYFYSIKDLAYIRGGDGTTSFETIGAKSGNLHFWSPPFTVGEQVGGGWNSLICAAVSFHDQSLNQVTGTICAGGITLGAPNSSGHHNVNLTSDGSLRLGAFIINGNSLYNIELLNTGNAIFNGKITAKEIEVKVNVWADHVFNKNYQLKPLAEVEKYIAANNHLPEVPSEAEVKENGVNVGEMNALLLKKIEELTLYTIQLKKEIDALKQNQNMTNIQK